MLVQSTEEIFQPSLLLPHSDLLFMLPSEDYSPQAITGRREFTPHRKLHHKRFQDYFKKFIR